MKPSRKNVAKLGVIGCGNISVAYFKGCKDFKNLEIVACADLNIESARARALEYGVKACTVEELLADPTIQLVINLTIPAAHAPVNLRILKAGKHAYCEKPFAIDGASGRKVLDLARRKGLRVGCAPDTFLGGGIQTCRKIIDDGSIGKPVAATAFMLCGGHETWHPSPAFYYQKGGGPMFDMGPYYLTAMVNLMGPVRRVSGATAKSFSHRTITSKALYGTRVKVEVPTHLAGTLEFASGAIGTVIMSFDVPTHHLPRLEIYGTEGSLAVPDPNTFGGPVSLSIKRGPWNEVPLSHSDKVARGTGVADMVHAIQARRSHRVSGALAYHVLEIMEAFEKSSKSGRHITIRSTCERPKMLSKGKKIRFD